MAHSEPSLIPCNIDFDRDGKQFGYLSVPHSRNESAWGSLLVPIVCVRNGDSPTVLFTAGNHGDEYEGQVALHKLARELSPENITGRVIIMPALNLPAVRGAARLSPLDGGNMNRSFPGHPRGTLTQRVAHYVTVELLERADIVVDMHSGGKSLDFVPSAIMHELDDRERFGTTLAALKAFGAPVSLILKELDSIGMLDTEAENMGKIFISTELGGAGTLSPRSVEIADNGVRNLLRHFGVLEGEPSSHHPTRMMDTPDNAFVKSEVNGIYEPFYALGDEVKAGEPLGQIHDFERPEAPPLQAFAPIDGMLFCRHVAGLTTRGDSLAVIAVDRDA
ncbi:MAG: succinylglutamate desuccinylase/aspartoacylase family protein [Rhodovibrionaceae bacterium]|nr:succinylglutamate desuccinylase/aspartoacylase family protein [Rhodovibrionaceae bacterium]